MIGVSSSNKSFRALARYLVEGRAEAENRVAWITSRNLPSDDPELAARIMRATAAQNVRVKEPVYHVALSFDPGDVVDRAAMERVADRVVETLGLQEHQVLIVAHADRDRARRALDTLKQSLAPSIAIPITRLVRSLWQPARTRRQRHGRCKRPERFGELLAVDRGMGRTRTDDSAARATARTAAAAASQSGSLRTIARFASAGTNGQYLATLDVAGHVMRVECSKLLSEADPPRPASPETRATRAGR